MRRHPLLPSIAQERLLQAAFLPAERARAAWKSLVPTFDLETLEPGSFGLLPVLSQRDELLGIDDPMRTRLRGIRRSVWFKNQLALERLAPATASLEGEHVRTALVGGVGICVSLGDEGGGRRSVPSLELLVEPNRVHDAAAVLERDGWQPRAAAPHSAQFESESGLPLQLRERPCNEFPAPQGGVGSLADIWAASTAPGNDPIRSRRLDPADALLFACLDGATPSPWRTVQWAADAMFVLSENDADLDWQRLTTHAYQVGGTASVRRALNFLRATVDALVSPEALAELAATRLPLRERLAERSSSDLASRVVPRAGVAYLRATARSPVRTGVARAPSFFRDAWAVNDESTLSAAILRKLARKLR